MKNRINKSNWSIILWIGDNFRKWGWHKPCGCGCDSRGDTSYYYLEKYFTGGLGLFGFTIKKHISIALKVIENEN